MSDSNEYILRGPPVGPVPDCSFAEYLVPKMRALPKDHLIQVDADTGAVQTVSELLGTSIRLSEGMKKLGLQEEDVVALLSRNCFDASAVVLGTWLSAAAVAPSPPNLKIAELNHIFSVALPKFIFCEKEALDTVTAAANLLQVPPTVVVIDTEGPSEGGLAFRDVLVEVDVDSYRPQPVTSPSTQSVGIFFSSGSSGLPKGVVVTHRNMIFQDLNMKWLVDHLKVKTCLQVSCFFWVTGVLMFLKSITEGICRVLLRETSVPKLLQAIQRYKPDWSLMAPSLVLDLVNSPEFDSCDVSSMKRIFVGGSPLTPAMAHRIKSKWKTIALMNIYGTTESSGSITMTEEENFASVGKVSPGVEVKVADTQTGAALKAGMLGEVCCRSLGVMKGYMGNEEKTREAVDPEGWYHTGDLGYYDDTGRLFLVDRMKEMVKIKNHQVAPVEVENTILEVPGVAEVAVAPISPDENLTYLMALVVKAKHSTVTEEDICSHVAATLSDTKRLTAGVHFIDNIPKTNSGKLKRYEIKKQAQALYSNTRKR